MIEVYPHLWVGAQTDLVHVQDHDHVDGQVHIKDGWFVVTAAKEPWHRQALGYTGRAASKDHPEYLWAERQRRVILNLVDVDDPAYIRREIMDHAASWISRALTMPAVDGRMPRVLVHCNQGQSRAPTVALWFMHKHTDALPADREEAIALFKSKYPAYEPAQGMAKWIEANW